MSSHFKLPEFTKDKFIANTLSFMFIIAYVNIFQMALGAENSIVGVIFAIMMSASMVRDLTANPFRHLFIQAVVLMSMALAAYWVNVLPAPFSFLINFTTLLGILYAYTYEYSSHMYFPYILSYLFLIFITPANFSQLPRRLMAMAAGALCIILYQWFKGRKRVAETARDELSKMIDKVLLLIAYKLEKSSEQPELSGMRLQLCRLSQTVYDRRKKILCISDAGFSMIATGHGLTHLMMLIQKLPRPLSEQEIMLLLAVGKELQRFRAYIHQEITELSPLECSGIFDSSKGDFSRIYSALCYTRHRLLHMTDTQKKQHYPQTALSLKIRFLTAVNYSPVRGIYALRTALLLSCATLFVQTMGLPHGKWLLFTLASVSLPYADDIPQKMKKRTIATVTGGLISVLIYSLVPSPAGRTAAMMLSGYVSYYFTDYKETFACSTIGALGGAVFMSAFGFQAVGTVFLIRLFYVLLGIGIGYAVNCLIFPYRRAKAAEELLKKYRSCRALLADICHSRQMDSQLYYHLIIQAHLQEEALMKNGTLKEWPQLPDTALDTSVPI